MFCIKCGTKLEDDARFCPQCGFSVPEQLYNQSDQAESTPTQTEHYTQYQHTHGQDESAEIREFVGDNADYYLRKWGKSSAPGKSNSWNWPAFFISVYWLAYRRMYKYMTILLSFNVLIAILSGFAGYYHNTVLTVILDLISLGIMVFMGLYSNALYYRHMEKKLQQWHSDSRLQSAKTIGELGGTRWLGVIIILVSSFALGIIVAITMFVSIFTQVINTTYTTSAPATFTAPNHQGNMNFGTGSDDKGVTGKADSFSVNSPIFLEASFSTPLGTDKINVYLLQQEDNHSKMIDSWFQKVDPSWNYVYFNIFDPSKNDYLKPGHYIVQILTTDDDLLNEGEFDITPFSTNDDTNKIDL